MVGESTGHDWVRIGLIVCCLLAAVATGTLVSGFAASDHSGSPAEQLFPGDRFAGGQSGGSGSGASSLSAMNPGGETSVGGDVGVDDTFRTTDTEVHFAVDSPEPAYWRTAVYDTYTGSGWERPTATEPYEGALQYDGLDGERFTYQVELATAARALPTAWRPTSVEGVDGSLTVTDGRAIRPAEGISAGETFTATSIAPERDPAVLRASGDDYPEPIHERYTQLPAGTPDRIGDLTAELTADDDTAFDTAMTVQNWLRSEKEYSLDASAAGDQIADRFIFEMEAGYCEYFATAMVTMLRSQGIPARYAVGYSTGERVDGTYQVRAMNAHAWVEVYFPDVGWVHFEPTPGGERLATQQEALAEEEPDREHTLQEPGSPGEQFEPGEVNRDNSLTGAGEDSEEGDEDDQDTNETDDQQNEVDEVPSQATISLNRSAVPGATVEVRVLRSTASIQGVYVYFNGERVGRTDENGTVVATVPYVEQLRITAPMANVAPIVGLAPDGDLDPMQTDTGGGKVVPVETDATVTVSGDPIPGSTVTVTATVEDVPVRNATVLLDGERIGQTDANGQAQVTLPSEPGDVSIAVERDPVSGTTTVQIPEVTVTASADWPIPLPGTPATVTVRADGEPVVGTQVTLDGERAATTDENGTATVTLPIEPSATFGTTYLDSASQATVGGMLRNALGVLLVGGIVLGGLLYWGRRRDYSLRGVVARLVGLPRAVVGYATLALVVAATQSGAVRDRIGRRIRSGARTVRDVLTGQQSPVALSRALVDSLRKRWTEAESSTDRPTGEADDAYVSIREAWRRFLGVTSVPNAQTHTPGELAQHAVHRDGLPREPVRTLRDAFREVEYGNHSPERRLERVTEAIETIETSAEPTDEPRTDGGEQ